MTKLGKTMRREIDLRGAAHTVTVGRDGVRIARKGHRHGASISWTEVLARGEMKQEPRS